MSALAKSTLPLYLCPIFVLASQGKQEDFFDTQMLNDCIKLMGTCLTRLESVPFRTQQQFIGLFEKDNGEAVAALVAIMNSKTSLKAIVEKLLKMIYNMAP